MTKNEDVRNFLMTKLWQFMQSRDNKNVKSAEDLEEILSKNKQVGVKQLGHKGSGHRTKKKTSDLRFPKLR